MKVIEITSTSAVIEFTLDSDSPLQDGAVQFGTDNALTFAPRKLHGTEKGSDLSRAINKKVWQESQTIQSLNLGKNRVELSGLQANTNYFCRILASNKVSRIWNPKTTMFRTGK